MRRRFSLPVQWFGIAFWLGVVVCSAHAAPAAQPKDTQPRTAAPTHPSAGPERAPTTPTPSGNCGHGTQRALTQIACALALELGPSTALVATAPVTDIHDRAQAARLANVLSLVVASSLGNAAPFTSALSLTEARSQAAKRGALVYLQARLQAGELQVSADLYNVPARFWDRVRNAKPAALHHAYAAQRLDGELRSFLPAVALVAGNVSKALAPEPAALALHCGDFGHAGLELLVVGRQAVVLGRLRSGRVLETRRQRWRDLSPVAPTPLREPIASVVQSTDGSLTLGSSDRLNRVELDAELALRGRAEQSAPWDIGGCSAFDVSALSGALRPCSSTPALTAFTRAPWPWPLDAFASSAFVTPSGELRRVRAARRADSDQVRLEDDQGHVVEATGFGAALALADIDGDGDPELLSSADVRDPSRDALSVHTWKRGAQRLDARYTLPVPAGVHALDVCPSDDGGRLAIVLATATELWVIR